MKIYRLPASDPKKFGPKRVQSRRNRTLEEHGQLNLFSGKIFELNAGSPFESALKYDEAGEYLKAQEWYLKAVEAEDSTADAYCNLGIIASEEGRYAEAVDYLTLCLKHDHRHYEAHFNLANIYSEAGNIALAKFHYQIAIKLEPGFSNSYFNLALLLVVNREYEEAIKKLKNYLQLVPESEHVPALELIEKLSDLK